MQFAKWEMENEEYNIVYITKADKIFIRAFLYFPAGIVQRGPGGKISYPEYSKLEKESNNIGLQTSQTGLFVIIASVKQKKFINHRALYNNFADKSVH